MSHSSFPPDMGSLGFVQVCRAQHQLALAASLGSRLGTAQGPRVLETQQGQLGQPRSHEGQQPHSPMCVLCWLS